MVRLASLKYVHIMAYKYRWLDLALDDMANEIDFVLREFGKKAARKVETDVHDRVLQISQFPFSGEVYEDLLFHDKEVRAVRMRHISIIYCFQDEIVTLIAIWDNSQDPEKLSIIMEER